MLNSSPTFLVVFTFCLDTNSNKKIKKEICTTRKVYTSSPFLSGCPTAWACAEG